MTRRSWREALTSSLTDETAAAQVRALELVLRELIHESYRGQDALLGRLREVFKAETIAKWAKSAGGADVLTGTSFGELASFFVNRAEYPRYQPVLEVEQYLAMTRERRKTLRSYLDALRLARNTLAHHKPLTALGLDEAGVERYLARGGDPNAVVSGNSLIHLTILGVDFANGGLGDDLPRKTRILQRLLDAGAKPSQADLDFVRVMGKHELLPLLER